MSLLLGSAIMIYVAATLRLVYIADHTSRRITHLMEESQRSLSPRDGGTPKGLRAPHSRWFVQWFAPAPPGWHFHVRRIRRSDIEHTLSAPYIVKWKSWELVAVAFGRIVAVYRWREEWADA